MIIKSYWSDDEWFIVSATKLLAGPFASRAAAAAHIEERTTRVWRGVTAGGWRVTVTL